MTFSSSRPCVSVLMPCRNGGMFLAEAIESVLADPAVLELVVADGASSDGSLDLLNDFAGRDPRVRLVSRPDRGPADALNRAFACARGTVIGWLNADDRYLRGAPSRAVEALSQHPRWLMVYGEGEHIDAQGKVLDTYPTRPPEVGLEGFQDFCFLCQPTVFWRRTLGVLLGPFDVSLKTCFDFDYWIRAFAVFPDRIGHLSVLQAQTRRHDATISTTQLPWAVLEVTMLQSRLFPGIRPHILKVYIEEILSGRTPLPPGIGAAEHADALRRMAEGMPLPAGCLAGIQAALLRLTAAGDAADTVSSEGG